MVLCELNAVREEDDETKPCYLAKECSSRYDNLFGLRNSRSFTTRSNIVEYQVAHREGELTIKGADTRTESAGKKSLISATLIFVFALTNFT